MRIQRTRPHDNRCSVDSDRFCQQVLFRDLDHTQTNGTPLADAVSRAIVVMGIVQAVEPTM
jgi:hypothetical protein